MPASSSRRGRAGAFDHRVELVEGEIWPVSIGSWHGRTQGRVIAQLWRDGVAVTSEPARERVPVRYADTDIAVVGLLGPAES